MKLTLELQIPEAIAPSNGDLIRLAPGGPEVIDEVPAGRLYVDGGVIVPAESGALKERRRISEEGAVNVSIAVGGKKNGIVAGPNINVRGLAAEDEEALDELIEELEEAAETAFSKLKADDRDDDEAVQTALIRAVRKAAERIWRKRPLVDVAVLRI